MIRQHGVEAQVLAALRCSAYPSTNEVVRVIHRQGGRTGRAAVRRALRVLEDEGLVVNAGDEHDAWKLS